MNKLLFALIASMILAGCAVDRSYGLSPVVQKADLDALPEPIGEYAYVIGPQEKLEIIVAGAEDLSGEFLTDLDGHVVFPHLGKVETGGKSPQEAAEIISDGLRTSIVLDPQIRIIPNEFAEPSISVGGQVKRPGSYSAIGRPTLLRVVNQAEGPSEYAKKDDVLVLRTVKGQRYVGLYNLAAIERGNYPDPQLYPNDVVMVGNSPASARFDDLVGLAPIISPLIFFLDRVVQ